MKKVPENSEQNLLSAIREAARQGAMDGYALVLEEIQKKQPTR
ncbi:hypothetical protein [Pseudomonas sp. LP_4_YM]|nr:hypothetical protein [Pseudomonas sp. LP_4_YM]MCY4124019.1 hypothetical protein [Pseudomonas sp.]TCT87614.1 hypothetical protein EC913_14038 [Pseudomonas sp. LP_4_YM]